MQHDDVIKDFSNILLKKSKIRQFDDGIGAFANRECLHPLRF